MTINFLRHSKNN